MINRKTALICLALIALMLAGAAWGFTAMTDQVIPSARHRPPLPLLLLLVFPVSSTIVVGSLYWTGLRARADATRLQPWYRWGDLLAISYCGGLLLLQAILVVQRTGFDVPPAVGQVLAVGMAIMSLLAINQMPKLPWFERRLVPGGELGPIHGPRFLRIQSRILILFLMAAFAFAFAAPRAIAVSAVPYILATTSLLVFGILAWRWHLGRKWRLERSAPHGIQS